MNKVEATKILEQRVEELKNFSYLKFLEWQQRKHLEIIEVESETRKHYKIEVQAMLEDRHRVGGNIKVIASIDDSHLLSLSKLLPLTRSFIITPDDTIVEE